MYYIYRDFSIVGWVAAILLLFYGLGLWHGRRCDAREMSHEKETRNDP